MSNNKNINSSNNTYINLNLDILTELLIRMDYDTMLDFMSAYPELEFLKKNRHFLNRLSEYHNIPYIDTISQYLTYLNTNISERFDMAVRKCDLKSVIRMIDYSNDIGYILSFEDLNKALANAALMGCLDIVKLIISLNNNNLDIKTAIMWAKLSNSYRVLEYLQSLL